MAWVSVLKAAFAEQLTPEELAVFKRVAGDRSPPSRRVRELWAAPIGRRAGKSRMAAAVATYLALLSGRRQLAPGEIGTVAVIAASREQASTVFNYIRGFLTSRRSWPGRSRASTTTRSCSPVTSASRW
jgi:phage terminase large subunit-like protein